jgi:hypothetical protein
MHTMSTRKYILALGIALALLPQGVGAHHSVAAQFDPEKMVMAVGVLSKVDWINPHTYFTFNVKQVDGKMISMDMESAAPGALRRAGVAGREAMKVGSDYTVFYHPSRDGSPTGLLMAFTLPDGRLVGASTQQSLDQAKKMAADAGLGWNKQPREQQR